MWSFQQGSEKAKLAFVQRGGGDVLQVLANLGHLALVCGAGRGEAGVGLAPDFHRLAGLDVAGLGDPVDPGAVGFVAVHGNGGLNMVQVGVLFHGFHADGADGQGGARHGDAFGLLDDVEHFLRGAGLFRGHAERTHFGRHDAAAFVELESLGDAVGHCLDFGLDGGLGLLFGFGCHGKVSFFQKGFVATKQHL